MNIPPLGISDASVFNYTDVTVTPFNIILCPRGSLHSSLIRVLLINEIIKKITSLLENFWRSCPFITLSRKDMPIACRSASLSRSSHSIFFAKILRVAMLEE